MLRRLFGRKDAREKADRERDFASRVRELV